MIEIVVPMLIGTVFMLLSVYLTQKYKHLEKNGRETKGVIFDEEISHSKSSGNLSTPIVRFVTANNLWITAKSSISFMPGFYKVGEKVCVLYDENEPSAFLIKSRSTKLILLSFGFLGLVLFAIGAYWLLVS